MLLLLPPSEAKTAAASGTPVDLDQLAHSDLAAHRERVARTLARVSGQPSAMEGLGVGATLSEQVRANITVLDNPAAPAAQVYTGVLYDAADMAAWDRAARERAASHLRIVSALWGLVSPDCRIPAYRLSMGTSLGPLGPLARWWRERLPADITGDDAVVVDCRSAAYVQAWRPTDQPWLQVVVEHQAGGRRTVVSHMAKHTRGILARHLMTRAQLARTVEQVADAASELVGAALVGVELHEPPARGPQRLVLVTGES